MRSLIYLFVFSIMLIACATAHRDAQAPLPAVNYFSKYTNLADALKGHPGLIISGVGEYAKIIVRRNNSVINQEPLYVLDGFPVGNHYTRANQLINMATVKKVQVLRSNMELTSYGDKGSSGVILINTK